MNDLIELPAESAVVKTAPPVDPSTLDTAMPLAVVFEPFESIYEKWKAKAAALTVTSIEQRTEMAQARLARLEVKEARVAVEKKRKSLVEGIKERASKIDGTARAIREKMEELEASLLESEQFAERHAAKLKAELKLARESELAPFMDAPIVTDLSDMSADDYAALLSNAKSIRQAKIDAAKKAEDEAKAKAESDRLERERIAAENARLKEEAEKAEQERKRVWAEREADRIKAKEEADRKERERVEELRKIEAARQKELADLAEAARIEREKVAAAAKAEADKQAAISAEQKKKADEAAALARAEAKKAQDALTAKEQADREAEEKKRAEAEAMEKAKRKAAMAPDNDRLTALAATIRGLDVPTLSDPNLTLKLRTQTEKFAAWVESLITK